MLLQLENTNPENINKLLSFARENHLELSVIDDIENNHFLPGKPLTHHSPSCIKRYPGRIQLLRTITARFK